MIPEQLDLLWRARRSLAAAKLSGREVIGRVPPADAEQQIAMAERFLAVTEEMIGGPPPEGQ